MNTHTTSRARIRGTAFAALALSASLAFTACAGDPEVEEPTPAPDSQTHGAELPAGVNEIDLTFTREMIVHHEQAIEMSDIVLAKPDLDPQVAELAEEIKAAQGPEIEQLEAWLEEWDVEDETDTGDHSDDEHGDHGGMEGMLTEEDLDELEAADGPTASQLFLEQMIEHHEGAVAMAEPVVEGGENPDVIALAQDVIDAQTDEIAYMEELLETL